MPLSNVNLAAEVLDILRSAKRERKDEAVEKAASLARMDVPGTLSGITPRFEAYFANATLETALKNRENADSIERRLKLALALATRWVESTGPFTVV